MRQQSKKELDLSIDYLRSTLRYEAETGFFYWLVQKRPGSPIGSKTGQGRHNKGYAVVGLNGKYHLAHRLAWFYHNGRWPRPDMDIDHINGDKADNRIENLREATRSENGTNNKRRLRGNPHRGVIFHKKSGNWTAVFQHKHLGSRPTAEEARQLYLTEVAKFSENFPLAVHPDYDLIRKDAA